jgi:hypothetical protein
MKGLFLALCGHAFSEIRVQFKIQGGECIGSRDETKPDTKNYYIDKKKINRVRAIPGART